MSVVRKSERVMQVAREIVRLERELSLLRAELERLVPNAPADIVDDDRATVEEADAAPRPFLARTTSLLQRVQGVLDLSHMPLTAHDIAMQLDELNAIESIRTALSRLVGRETVERVSHGLYRSITAGHRRAAGEDD